jgi:hypothetical protein
MPKGTLSQLLDGFQRIAQWKVKRGKGKEGSEMGMAGFRKEPRNPHPSNIFGMFKDDQGR